MGPAFRVSDLRFLAALLLPAGLIYNLLAQPSHVGWAAFFIWMAVVSFYSINAIKMLEAQERLAGAEA